MTLTKQVTIGLDIGHKRIGVAVGDSIARLAMPLMTLDVTGQEVGELRRLLDEYAASRLVIGLPRNQSGSETLQSQAVRQYTEQQLAPLGLPITFQDESVTSVLAETYLSQRKKPYVKRDIDAAAAAIILQDYLEANHG
jgi:putative holliday junction resolvase